MDEATTHGPGRALGAAGAAAWGALGLAALVVLARYPLGRDHQIFALVGDAILAGGRPYVDAWDYKPPGIHLVTAAGRALSTAPIGVRLVEAAALASVAPAFAVAAERWVGDARAGLLGAVIAVTTVASFGFWHTGQPEVFAGVLLAWALALASARQGAAAWLGVGALCGAAALFKPTCALPGLVLAVWAADRQPSRLRGAGALAAHAAGLGAVLGATALAFHAWGALPDLVDAVFGFAADHAREAYVDDGPTEHLQRAALGLLRATPFAACCLVPLLALAPEHPAERAARGPLLGVVAASVVGVAVQGRFFLYHHAAGALLLGLPAGLGLWKALRALPERHRGGALLLAATALVALVTSASRTGLRGGVELEADRSHRALAAFSPAGIAEVGAYVAEHAGPGTLYVWGMEPGLYLASGREPASRYVTNEPQRTWWSEEARRAELLRELEREPPAAIVVERGDVIPFLLGTAEDSIEELRDFTALRHFLARGYTLRETFDTADVWLRRAEIAPASASPSQPSQPSSSGGR